MHAFFRGCCTAWSVLCFFAALLLVVLFGVFLASGEALPGDAGPALVLLGWWSFLLAAVWVLGLLPLAVLAYVLRPTRA